jgi:hypothetical protein
VKEDDARALVQAIVASAAVEATRAPSEATWGLPVAMPADVAALHAVSDGLVLIDGTRILGREEIAPATQWLKEDRSLTWDDDLFILGERDDLVIVRDLDLARRRAGGGVLEAPTDGLESFQRVGRDLLGYLAARVGIGDAREAPEQAARGAITRRDQGALARALGEPFYPGNESALAHAALTLGELRARAGDPEGAMQAFVLSAETRARAARRGAEASERAAGFRACARVAEAAGAPQLAAACSERAKTGTAAG